MGDLTHFPRRPQRPSRSRTGSEEGFGRRHLVHRQYYKSDLLGAPFEHLSYRGSKAIAPGADHPPSVRQEMNPRPNPTPSTAAPSLKPGNNRDTVSEIDLLPPDSMWRCSQLCGDSRASIQPRFGFIRRCPRKVRPRRSGPITFSSLELPRSLVGPTPLGPVSYLRRVRN